MALEISPATDADLKVLAAIPSAEAPDLYQRAVWRPAAAPADAAQARTELLELDLYLALRAPHCRVFTATVPRTDAGPRRGIQGVVARALAGAPPRTVVGWGSVQVEHDGVAAYAPPDYVPAGFDREVEEYCGRRMVEARRRHLGERKHVVWRHLYVLAEHRNQGIARAMVAWADAQFPELAAEPVWLQCPDAAAAAFHKLGWRDAEVVDLDLARFTTGAESSGIHRLHAMIREPPEHGDPSATRHDSGAA